MGISAVVYIARVGWKPALDCATCNIDNKMKGLGNMESASIVWKIQSTEDVRKREEGRKGWEWDLFPQWGKENRKNKKPYLLVQHVHP